MENGKEKSFRGPNALKDNNTRSNGLETLAGGAGLVDLPDTFISELYFRFYERNVEWTVTDDGV